MIQRTYQGEQDQQLMMALVQSTPSANLRINDLPYRLSSWALDDPDNVGLWTDDHGHLLAWAVLQTPFWTVDYALHADAPPSLHQDVLRWIDQRIVVVRGTPYARPVWFINVFDDQHQRMANLEAHGWADQAHAEVNPWSKVYMVRSSTEPVADAPLPAGLTIRPLAGPSEVAAYVALHRAVFQSKSMTEAWRRRTLEQPAYRPDLDLVATTADGQLAAFCVCWFDPHGATGQIEPLGVRADQRGHGLASAILSEGLRRLHALGAEVVVLETDNYRDAAFALYQSVGFEVKRTVLVYRKDDV